MLRSSGRGDRVVVLEKAVEALRRKDAAQAKQLKRTEELLAQAVEKLGELDKLQKELEQTRNRRRS
jgi:hypothetical protein